MGTSGIAWWLLGGGGLTGRKQTVALPHGAQAHFKDREGQALGVCWHRPTGKFPVFKFNDIPSLLFHFMFLSSAQFLLHGGNLQWRQAFAQEERAAGLSIDLPPVD